MQEDDTAEARYQLEEAIGAKQYVNFYFIFYFYEFNISLLLRSIIY